MFIRKPTSTDARNLSRRHILLGFLVGVVLLGAVYIAADHKRIAISLVNVSLKHGLFSLADFFWPQDDKENRLNRLLEAAVNLDDRQAIENYLNAGANPNHFGRSKLPLAYLAASKGFEGALWQLTAYGADIDFHPGQKHLPLLLMANKKKDKRAFQLLLNNGSNPDVISDNGYPIAYICLRQKQYDWFKLLAAQGADLTYISPTGRTMLDYAIKYGHKETIALLEKHHVPTLRTKKEGSALIAAVQRNDSEAVAERLKAGDSPYLIDKYGSNALEAAARSEAVEAARTLLAAGVDPNLPYGAPLRAAVRKSNLTLVNLFLENGARPDERGGRLGMTALHEAVCRSLPIAKALVDHGGDVNASQSFREKTPLWWAINCGNAEIVAYLEAQGARYTVDNAWYRTATVFEKAAADGDIETMAAMLAEGQDINARDAFGDTALHFAAAAGQMDAIRWLVDRGALPMFRGDTIHTPLFWAAYHGQEEACRYLLKKGCRLKDKDAYGDTPLHYAAAGNRPAVVKLFLDRGADVHANAKEKTPLVAAARRNAGQAVQALIDGGADIHYRDDDGRTALHEATIYDSPEAARILIANRADIHAKDNYGRSALEMAEGRRNKFGGSQVYRQLMRVAGTSFEPSFNCDQAKTAVEHLVCTDRGLADLDVEMDRYYQVLIASLDRQRARRLKAEQREWLEQRSTACVYSQFHYPEDDAYYEAIKCLQPSYQVRGMLLKNLVRKNGFSMDTTPASKEKSARVKTWGDYTNHRKEAGNNRFKAFYYNTNDPMNVTASEFVDQISINYHFDKFNGIRSENFGAYWVGTFDYENARQEVFQVATSRARMKIVVDGIAIYDSNNAKNVEIAHRFSKGKHLIEVEYASNWHATDLLIRIAEREPLYNAADARIILADTMVPGAQLWYVGVYESDAMDHKVKVAAEATERPVVLLLSSYSPVNWVIANSEQNRILAVIHSSREPGSSVSLPNDPETKVYRVHRNALTNVYKLPEGWWAGVENLSDTLAPVLGANRLDGFSGIYGTRAVLVPSLTKDNGG